MPSLNCNLTAYATTFERQSLDKLNFHARKSAYYQRHGDEACSEEKEVID